MESNGNAIITLVEKYVNVGKTVTLPLCGFSMRPFLEDNRDMALLSAPPETLRIGDVILARLVRRNKFVLHRITGIDGDIITMCGDGNYTPEFVRRQNVVAIALGFYRKGSTELDSVNAISYRLYWRVWLLLKPIRRWLLLTWKTYHYPMQAIANIKEILHITK